MKPTIAFESLAVAANVSSGCALLSTNSAEYICPVVDEEAGWTIFSDYAVCTMVPESNDQVCYDIPIANSNVFSS
jgi:hypothetical protein